MKKLAVIVATAFMALCLAGCSGMTKEEYEDNLNVQYFLTGEFITDFYDLHASLPIEESKDLDYDAMSNLQTHCENILNLEGCPKEYAEAHENLEKAANTILSLKDLMVDCAASMETYFITNDSSLIDSAIEDLEAVPAMMNQAIDYVKEANEIIQAH